MKAGGIRTCGVTHGGKFPEVIEWELIAACTVKNYGFRGSVEVAQMGLAFPLLLGICWKELWFVDNKPRSRCLLLFTAQTKTVRRI